MGYAWHHGVRLYWEEHGEGPPILLVMGLSFTLEMWHRLTPALARHYRVIQFDNRGVGRSDVPPGRYSIGEMAGDALAVLDAAHVREPVRLLGASMGGMIAQELTLRYPERVRALMLACTACDPVFRDAWPRIHRAPRFWNWFSTRGEERERLLIHMLYADTTPGSRIEEDIRIRAACQPPVHAVLRQFAGILSWSSYRRLPRIKVPTLVVHGDQDHILPASNGRTIARRIPHAQFVLLPDTGHMIATDQPELSVDIMMEFLKRIDAVDPAAARMTGKRSGLPRTLTSRPGSNSSHHSPEFHVGREAQQE